MATGPGGLIPRPAPAGPSTLRPSLCNAAGDAYVAAMAILPRPVSPKSALSDLRDMFAPERPHRWSLLGLSCALTGILLWGFVLDSRKPPKPREILYVENWMADRKDSDVIRQQIKDLALYEAALEKKQREFQKVADNLGIEWREDEARNAAQRKSVIVAINKRLQERLAKALAEEAGKASAGPATVTTAR
jgi:hypothetical protein